MDLIRETILFFTLHLINYYIHQSSSQVIHAVHRLQVPWIVQSWRKKFHDKGHRGESLLILVEEEVWKDERIEGCSKATQVSPNQSTTTFHFVGTLDGNGPQPIIPEPAFRPHLPHPSHLALHPLTYPPRTLQRDPESGLLSGVFAKDPVAVKIEE